jgi:glycosyltransferase involved in cell wall biosynthesis
MAALVSRIAPEFQTQVAPMPVDLERFTLPPADTPREGILLVGRLNAQKGVADLLRAATHPALRGVPITIIGDGPDAATLHELARSLEVADRVTWIPGMAHGDLPARYQRAAVVCMPSRGEGLGLVGVEAQACGTPVVGYADGGLLDVVQTGPGRGRLVPIGDVPALAEGLASVLREGSAIASDALREAVLDRFAPARVAAGYAAMYSAGVPS